MTDEERQSYRDNYGIDYQPVFIGRLREYGFVNGDRKRPYMFIRDMRKFMAISPEIRSGIDREFLYDPKLEEWKTSTADLGSKTFGGHVCYSHD